MKTCETAEQRVEAKTSLLITNCFTFDHTGLIC